ncbi:MAG: creatininase family protein [Fimbriimonadaceae bacterium]|nr:creatininase family protein [Fimbriimonadaceae bacterium]
MPSEVRLELLRPAAIEAALAACPTLFQPLGTIEWHGLHNIVGLDAVKAHHLCVRAAQRGGGLVAPPVYGGIGGLDEVYTFVTEAEDQTTSVLLRNWLDRLVREAVRSGFRAVILLTGHYGSGQQMIVRDAAAQLTQTLGVPVLGTPEYLLAVDAGYHGDHAAWGETALMLELDPTCVDLSTLGEPPHRGVGGRDPREATAADGARLVEVIVSRLARLAAAMPTWDRATCWRFAAAEAAMVARQRELAVECGQTWAAWRQIHQGSWDAYPDALVDGRFEDYAALIAGW